MGGKCSGHCLVQRRIGELEERIQTLERMVVNPMKETRETCDDEGIVIHRDGSTSGSIPVTFRKDLGNGGY